MHGITHRMVAQSARLSESYACPIPFIEVQLGFAPLLVMAVAFETVLP